MTELTTKARSSNILRIVVCLMSFGFIFPNALMEGEDAARLLARQQLEAKETAREP